jgi:hypothetical protein
MIRDLVVRRLAPADDVDIDDDAQLEHFIRTHGGTMYHQSQQKYFTHLREHQHQTLNQ